MANTIKMPNGEILKHIENTDLSWYYARGGKLVSYPDSKKKTKKKK